MALSPRCSEFAVLVQNLRYESEKSTVFLSKSHLTLPNYALTFVTIGAAATLSIDHVEGIDMINLNGFKGGYTEVVSDGNKVFIMGLIDPDSDVNFFIVISFAEGDGLATEEAIAICQGLSKM